LSYRVVAVDEELGITLLRINFGRADRYGVGNALMVWEAFKVYGGQIHAVEAFMKIMPAMPDRAGIRTCADRPIELRDLIVECSRLRHRGGQPSA
jgi:hypothetical protein